MEKREELFMRGANIVAAGIGRFRGCGFYGDGNGLGIAIPASERQARSSDERCG